jgi:hypothetical protein
MCCDAETLTELCELHNRSTLIIELDAEARHAKLLEFMMSGKHREIEDQKKKESTLEKAMKFQMDFNRREN